MASGRGGRQDDRSPFRELQELQSGGTAPCARAPRSEPSYANSDRFWPLLGWAGERFIVPALLDKMNDTYEAAIERRRPEEILTEHGSLLAPVSLSHQLEGDSGTATNQG